MDKSKKKIGTSSSAASSSKASSSSGYLSKVITSSQLRKRAADAAMERANKNKPKFSNHNIIVNKEKLLIDSSFSKNLPSSTASAPSTAHNSKNEKKTATTTKTKLELSRRPKRDEKKAVPYVCELLDLASSSTDVYVSKVLMHPGESLASMHKKALQCTGFGKNGTRMKMFSPPPVKIKKEDKVNRSRAAMVTGSPTKPGTGRKAKSIATMTKRNLIDLFDDAADDDSSGISSMDESIMDESMDDEDEPDQKKESSGIFLTSSNEDNEPGTSNKMDEDINDYSSDDEMEEDPDYQDQYASDDSSLFTTPITRCYQKARRSYRYIFPPDFRGINKYESWDTDEKDIDGNKSFIDEEDEREHERDLQEAKRQAEVFKDDPPCPDGPHARYLLDDSGEPVCFNRSMALREVLKNVKFDVICYGCKENVFHCKDIVHGRYCEQATYAFAQEMKGKKKKPTMQEFDANFRTAYNRIKNIFTWLKARKDERKYDTNLNYSPPLCMMKGSYLTSQRIFEEYTDPNNTEEVPEYVFHETEERV